MSTPYERPEHDRGELGNSGAHQLRPRPLSPVPPPELTTPAQPEPPGPRPPVAPLTPPARPAPPGGETPQPAAGQPGNLTERLTKAYGVPATIKYAYMMWMAVAILIVLLAFIQAVAPSGLTGTLRVADLVIGTLLAVVFALGCVFAAIRMKEGANWARVVLTVIALLSILSLFVYLIIDSVDWINALAAIVAGVLMWLPGSQAWFKEHSKATAQR